MALHSQDAFRARYGPVALVAGASEGIGAEFAEQLAQRGLDLLLIARRAEPLETLAGTLRARRGVAVTTLARDLGDADHLAEIVGVAATLDVGLLVCNAALAPIGYFLNRPIAEHRALIDVNCRAIAVLAHAIGTRLTACGRGGVILVSSLAGLQGTAMTAHYAASKAYIRVLAEGLWDEFRPHGVDVCTVLAGPTSTPGYIASRPRETRWGGLRVPPVQAPRAVVDAALAGLGVAPVVYPGMFNGAVGFLMQRVLPRIAAIRMVSRETRKMYDR